MAIKRRSTANNKTAAAAATKKDDLPIFLKKTFHLINTCDPNIASWSDDGKLFIVKDPELFASDVIPQVFRHSNFASFVRQLNFYGFKKIKNDSIHLVNDNPDWWKFKHENFLRGRPDLLPLIKKAHQINAVNKEEVDKLREEVGQLKGMVHMMAAQLQQLTGYEVNVNVDTSSNKKRKLEEEAPALPAPQPDVTSSYSSSMPPLPALPNMEQQQQYEQPDPQLKLSLLDPMVSDQDLLVDDWNVDTGVLPERGLERIKSADIVESMFDFVKEDNENEGVINDVPPIEPALLKDFLPDTINSFNRSVSYHSQGEETPAQLNPTLTAKLNNAIAKLPKALQESFVERMAEQIASPEAYQKHVNAVEVLANAATIQAQKQTHEQKDNVQGDKLSTAALSAAALGAFLTKYQDGEAAYEPVKQ
jgi:hypothetical protein